MKRTGKDTPDLFSALDSGAAALNNARVVRDAQRADHELEPSADDRLAQARSGRGSPSPAPCWCCGRSASSARLVYLQVYQYDALIARAESQQSQTIDLNPRRGPILDRYGRVLAYSVDADVIYAVPSDVKDPEALATRALRGPRPSATARNAGRSRSASTPVARGRRCSTPCRPRKPTASRP